MKKVYNLFFLFTAIFLAGQVLLRLQIPLPTFVTSYLNDFLCMPIILTISMEVVRRIKKLPGLRLSLFTVLSLTAFYSVYFELYMPEVHSRYTADIMDVVMYLSGALLYYFLQPPPKKATKPLSK